MNKLCLIWILFLPLALQAQEHPVEEYQLPRSIPAEDVMGLEKFSGDYLYALTRHGLFAFDGIHWDRFQKKDGSSEILRCMTPIHQRSYLTGSEDGSIHRFENQQFKRIELPNCSISSPVIALERMESGSIWIATYGEGIIHWDPNTDSTHRIAEENGLISNDIYDIAIHRNGKLYIATDLGLQTIDQNPGGVFSLQKPSQSTLGSRFYNQLYYDSTHHRMIAADYDGGVYLIRESLDSIRKILQMDEKLLDLCGVENQLVLATSDAIFQCSLDSTAKLTAHPILTKGDHQIRSPLIVDEEMRLWGLSESQDLLALDLQISIFSPALHRIQAIETIEKEVFVGTDHGLFLFTSTTGSTVELIEGINVTDIYCDSNAAPLWVATLGQGVFQITPKGEIQQLFNEASGLINDHVLSIERSGPLLYAATLGGLSTIEMDKKEVVAPPFPEIPQSQYIYDSHVDQNGRLWIGKDRRGAVRILSTGQMKTFAEGETIYKILELPSGEILLSSSEAGIFKITMEDSIDNFFPNNPTLGMIADENGKLYLMTEEGIFAIPSLNQPKIPLLPPSMESSFSSHINACSRDQSGNLWFSGTDQILRYQPSAQSMRKPTLIINSAQLGQHSLLKTNPPEFSASTNLLRLNFSGLWFQDPGAVEYRYRLKGYDPEWIETKDQQLIYPQLPPGEYLLELQCSISEPFQKMDDHQIAFTILPPLWQRPWFFIPAILLLSGLLAFVIHRIVQRNRTLDQLQTARVKSELDAIKSQINPHFLFNSFNTLINVIEEKPENAVEYVEHLSDFYRNMLAYRKQTFIPLEEEIQLAENYLFLLQKRFADGIRYSIQGIPENGEQILPLSLQMLIENAIKHNRFSPKAPLEITIEKQGEMIAVTNTLNPKKNAPVSTDFGLESLNRQYKHYCGKEISVEKSERHFQVRLPLIKKSTT